MNKNITTIAVLVVGLIIAIILGTVLPTAQIEVIAITVGSVFIISCFALKEKVWLLIPATLAMTGSIPFVPGNPWIWQIMTISVAGVLVLRYIMGVRDFSYKIQLLDVMIALQFIALAQAYLRNPIGMSFFGSDMIGAKPYYQYGVVLIAYMVLASVNVTLASYKYCILLMVVIGIFDATLAVIAGFIPSIGWFLIRFYNHRVLALDQYGLSVTSLELESSRFAFCAKLGKIGLLTSATLWRPVTSINPLHPLRCLVFVAGFITALLSGFRSLLVAAALHATCGSIARKKIQDVVIGGGAAFIILAIIMMTGLARKLPYGVQRAISFVPGVEVSGEAAESATRSADWRFEMWDLALSSDRYIKNKMLGDGFGLSATEYNLAIDQQLGLVRMNAENRFDFMMAKGSYHSFLIETIRYTGVFGLLLAIIAMIYFAKFSWGLIKYYRGRQEFGYVLFVTVPMLIYPIYYVFIIGSYKSITGFSMILVQVGFLKMLDKIRRKEISESINEKIVEA